MRPLLFIRKSNLYDPDFTLLNMGSTHREQRPAFLPPIILLRGRNYQDFLLKELAHNKVYIRNTTAWGI